MTVGHVDTAAMGFEPSALVTTFDLDAASTQSISRSLREFKLVTVDEDIEIGLGIIFPSWAYQRHVPGPTHRCNDGDQLQIRFPVTSRLILKTVQALRWNCPTPSPIGSGST